MRDAAREGTVREHWPRRYALVPLSSGANGQLVKLAMEFIDMVVATEAAVRGGVNEMYYDCCVQDVSDGLNKRNSILYKRSLGVWLVLTGVLS